ncbi:hypothetical protein [Actinokineospora pegani]|uniref:hypothetical protein n=1 Tax=Actinokineospora pegani TaxID=2654637 RepID=UPI0012EB039D|nr:hypothetical protein [Actinokineospora pegani]
MNPTRRSAFWLLIVLGVLLALVSCAEAETEVVQDDALDARFASLLAEERDSPLADLVVGDWDRVHVRAVESFRVRFQPGVFDRQVVVHFDEESNVLRLVGAPAER